MLINFFSLLLKGEYLLLYFHRHFEEKDLDHQVFYTPAGGLDVTVEYANNDSAGNPLGTEFTLTANTASSGSLTFTLVHEPTKPNTGLEDAGGEIDIETAFNITIE